MVPQNFQIKFSSCPKKYELNIEKNQLDTLTTNLTTNLTPFSEIFIYFQNNEYVEQV